MLTRDQLDVAASLEPSPDGLSRIRWTLLVIHPLRSPFRAFFHEQTFQNQSRKCISYSETQLILCEGYISLSFVVVQCLEQSCSSRNIGASEKKTGIKFNFNEYSIFLFTGMAFICTVWGVGWISMRETTKHPRHKNMRVLTRLIICFSRCALVYWK